MASLAGFDASKVEPADFGVLPAGEYQACIVNSELKDTKDGSGNYLNLEIQVTNGQYQNRRLFEKLNLKNKNDTAVRIAKATLSSICRAVGVLTPQDSAELHYKPFAMTVGVRNNEYKGEMENYVKSYKKLQGVATPVPQTVFVVEPETTEVPKTPWSF